MLKFYPKYGCSVASQFFTSRDTHSHIKRWEKTKEYILYICEKKLVEHTANTILYTDTLTRYMMNNTVNDKTKKKTDRKKSKSRKTTNNVLNGR